MGLTGRWAAVYTASEKELTMRKLTLLACLLLAGCAANVLSSNGRSVVVRAGALDVAGAQAVADAECKKVGRIARLNDKIMLNQFVYDCVE